MIRLEHSLLLVLLSRLGHPVAWHRLMVAVLKIAPISVVPHPTSIDQALQHCQTLSLVPLSLFGHPAA